MVEHILSSDESTIDPESLLEYKDTFGNTLRLVQWLGPLLGDPDRTEEEIELYTCAAQNFHRHTKHFHKGRILDEEDIRIGFMTDVYRQIFEVPYPHNLTAIQEIHMNGIIDSLAHSGKHTWELGSMNLEDLQEIDGVGEKLSMTIKNKINSFFSPIQSKSGTLQRPNSI